MCLSDQYATLLATTFEFAMNTQEIGGGALELEETVDFLLDSVRRDLQVRKVQHMIRRMIVQGVTMQQLL
jgi:hypothetical protein